MTIIIIILSTIVWLTIWSTILCYVDNFWTQENWINGRSRCDKCKHKLNIVDLIPILWYIVNKKKCRYCKQEINKKYIIYELIFGIMWWGITWIYLYKSDYNLYDANNIYNTIRRLTNTVWISMLALSDIRYKMVDLKVVVTGVVANICMILLGQVYNDMDISWFWLFENICVYVWWGYIIYILGKLVYKLKHKSDWEGFGVGDIWVMWYISTVIYFAYMNETDPMQTIVYYTIWIVLSCIFGILYYLIFCKPTDNIPFVPCMLLSMVVMSILSQYIWQLYQMYLGI